VDPSNVTGNYDLFGILIYFMLYPQKGRRMRDTWDSPYHNAWTKFLVKGRFLQLCSFLHFNILKYTLGKYAEHGSELSLEEATMANKSSYGRF
jgi:hypothetical protein